MNLFLDRVGHSVVQDQNLKDIVNKIVEQCGGLPLSIVTIAGSMKGVNDMCEWRNVLTELENRVKSMRGSDIQKSKIVSYNCSLYREDFVIGKVELIENWIDEGLLDGLRTRQEMRDRGHSILNKLENNCLLERATTRSRKGAGPKGVSTISHSTAKADLKMPNATHSWVTKTMNLKGCRAKYLQNYSHMAYTSSDNRGRGSGWALWFDNLIDYRQFESKGQDLYVRVTGALNRKAKTHKSVSKTSNDFSIDNKLGQGGFGHAYRGNLVDGQEIALGAQPG
ncbi:NB-ARC - like 10 [Theobroma cacao]|nr:NB-ARC - like 10 [Theobroma cacao]